MNDVEKKIVKESGIIPNSINNENYSDDLQTLAIFANNKRKIFKEEVNSLAYYGNGGFPYNVVLEMSISDRRINIKIINDRLKKQKESEQGEENVLTADTSEEKLKTITKNTKEKINTYQNDVFKVPMKKK